MMSVVEPIYRDVIPTPRALVVESDLSGRELLARVLRSRGYQVRTAIGGQQAMTLFTDEGEPALDLLILDLNLELADGLELLRLVAAMPEGHRPRRILALAADPAEFSTRIADLRVPIELTQKPLNPQRI